MLNQHLIVIFVTAFTIVTSSMSLHEMPTRTLAGVKVPDTPLIRKALDYARVNNDDQTYNHVVRSWLMGQANINNRAPGTGDIDLEAYAISAILHDLGWSKNNPDLVSPDRRFEIDSAIAARDFLRRESGGKRGGWDKHRIQLVWDAIALHTSTDIAPYKEAEVAITNLGIFMELVGPNTARYAVGDKVAVTQEEFDTIVKEFPRTGFKQYFRDTFCGFCRTKPETTYNNFMGQYGDKFVEGYSSVGKQAIDQLEASIIG